MFTLDTSLDYLFMVNREAITLYDAQGTSLGAVNDCIRLGGDLREQAPSDGNYLGYHISWRLPQPNTPEAIRPGFKIRDGRNYIHTVQKVSNPSAWNESWNCSCLALMVFNHTITVYLPTDGTDDYASPLTTVATPGDGSLTNLPAAIQERRCEIVNYQGKQGLRHHYSVWLLIENELAQGTILKDENNTEYRVLGTIQRKRIDELLEIECVIDP